MNCIIVEDQLPAQRILEKYISDAGVLNLVGTFTDALRAMELLKTEEVDLIFLDIHLPKISGLDFLKTLPNPPHVILTTAFTEYAIESYELNVVDYLLKPFSFQRFLKAISKVSFKKELYVENSPDKKETDQDLQEIYIKSGYDFIRIQIEDIVFIKADSDYTELHLNEAKYLSAESLRHWIELLPTNKFARVHKSYIINTTKITKVSGNQIYFKNNQMVPLGRAYKHEFIERFMN